VPLIARIHTGIDKNKMAVREDKNTLAAEVLMDRFNEYFYLTLILKRC
jgi:hypothetical protein